MKKSNIGILNSTFQLKNDWNIYSLKYLLKSKITDGPHETPKFIDEGIPFLSVDSIIDGKLTFENCRYISKEDYKKYKIKCNPRKNDIFMGKAASIGKIAKVDVDFPFSIWSPLALIRPNIKKIIPKFLEYSLKSSYAQDQIDQYSTSNTQKNISMDDIPRIKIIVPRINEQEQIAKYLDKKTTKIEQTITKNKQLITLLKEKKESLITEVVTTGLNKTMDLIESPAPWMPLIPRNWKINKFKFYLHINEKKGFSNAEVLSLYRDYGIIPKKSRNDNHNVTSEDTSNYKYVNKDAFVVNKMKAWQGSVAVSKYEGIVSPAYYVYKFTSKKLYPRYFHYLMRNKSYTPEYMRLSAGIRVDQWDLSRYGLENILILIPPISEQKQIADYLDDKTSIIDKTIEKIERNIELLEEYKESLIHHVVTGKIDVRGVEL